MRRSIRSSGALLPPSLALVVVLALTVPVAPASAEDYTVREGDTLSEIGERFGVPVGTIAGANGIADVHHVVAGRTLRIPGTDGAPGSGADAGPGFHLVRPGESLELIAQRYGLDSGDLARANGLTDRNQVWAGSRLRITDETPRPPTAASHVRIRPGDTLSEIAQRYGVSLRALVHANDVADPSSVPVGTWLRIPSGDFVCPVDGSPRFVNDFGMAKPGGRFHEGVDLYAATGTPVLASVDGRVEQIEGTRGGLQFWLHGDDGHVYVGTHLSRFGADGRVSAGTVIGYVGTSGNAVGSTPHLHFEWLPQGGRAANPYPFLAEAC